MTVASEHVHPELGMWPTVGRGFSVVRSQDSLLRQLFIFTPILQMRTLRLRDMKPPAQAEKCQSHG